MKYSKTIISLILSALLLLGMSGCNSDNDPIVNLPIANLPVLDSSVAVDDSISS